MKIKIKTSNESSFFIDRDNKTNLYFNDIRSYPILTKDEEIELVYKMREAETQQERDEARNKLIQSNLRFVILIAKKIGNRNSFMDLVNEGNMGLITAIDRFDPTIGVSIISYAVNWIISYIQEYQISTENPLIPPNAPKLRKYVSRATNEFVKENERFPSQSEIAEKIKEMFDFNVKSLDEIELGKMISIEENYGSDEEDSFKDSSVFNSKTSSRNLIMDGIDEEFMKHQIKFFLGKLTPREQYVITKAYGIDCMEQSLEDIAIDLGLVKERVRQIKNAAVDKMKTYTKQAINLKN